jgi:hypothetical protein
MSAKSITVAEIIKWMRRSNDEGIVYDPMTGNHDTLCVVLRRKGATAQQAAKAARRLGWASEFVEDWNHALVSESRA